MVEIAISLAIIAFALVAIIGVLPLGLDVQKENRQETIINQDAGYFMDAIRNGARGLDDLTNYVIAITNYWTLYYTNVPPGTPWQLAGVNYDGYDRLGSRVTSETVLPSFALSSGSNIVGLLSTPRYVPTAVNGPPAIRSNYIVAFVRALSGSATEKFPQSDKNVQSLAFSYRMIPEIVSLPAYDTNSPYGKNLQANLTELRLLFRWPLLPNWSAGNGRQSYRSLVGGQLMKTNDVNGQTLHFFEPTTFVTAP